MSRTVYRNHIGPESRLMFGVFPYKLLKACEDHRQLGDSRSPLAPRSMTKIWSTVRSRPCHVPMNPAPPTKPHFIPETPRISARIRAFGRLRSRRAAAKQGKFEKTKAAVSATAIETSTYADLWRARFVRARWKLELGRSLARKFLEKIQERICDRDPRRRSARPKILILRQFTAVPELPKRSN